MDFGCVMFLVARLEDVLKNRDGIELTRIRALAFVLLAVLASCASQQQTDQSVSQPEQQTIAAGYYTEDQASTGATIYSGKCAQCHGARLQGQSAPSLTGTRFAKSLEGYGNGAPLYDFISKQMPANAPGTLSKDQYLAVTAYILAQNGYPSGNHALDATTLSSVEFENATKRLAKNGSPLPNTNEIIRVAAPTTVTFATPPVSVNVSDGMMASAAGDTQDWLLGGRTYDNERYSPLREITTSNVASLAPAAIVQTGMPESFETTPIVVKGVMYITTPVVNNQMKIFALNAATGETYWTMTYNLGQFQICCGPVNRGVADRIRKSVRRYARRQSPCARCRDRQAALAAQPCRCKRGLQRNDAAATLSRQRDRRQRGRRVGGSRIRRGI